MVVLKIMLVKVIQLTLYMYEISVSLTNNHILLTYNYDRKILRNKKIKFQNIQNYFHITYVLVHLDTSQYLDGSDDFLNVFRKLLMGLVSPKSRLLD